MWKYCLPAESISFNNKHCSRNIDESVNLRMRSFVTHCMQTDVSSMYFYVATFPFNFPPFMYFRIKPWRALHCRRPTIAPSKTGTFTPIIRMIRCCVGVFVVLPVVFCVFNHFTNVHYTHRENTRAWARFSTLLSARNPNRTNIYTLVGASNMQSECPLSVAQLQRHLIT